MIDKTNHSVFLTNKDVIFYSEYECNNCEIKYYNNDFVTFVFNGIFRLKVIIAFNFIEPSINYSQNSPPIMESFNNIENFKLFLSEHISIIKLPKKFLQTFFDDDAKKIEKILKMPEIKNETILLKYGL